MNSITPKHSPVAGYRTRSMEIDPGKRSTRTVLFIALAILAPIVAYALFFMVYHGLFHH